MDSKVVHDVLAEVFTADEPPSVDGSAAVFARAARLRTRRRVIGAVAATAAVVATVTALVGAASFVAGLRHSEVPVGGTDSTPSSNCHADLCQAAVPGAIPGAPMGPPDFDVFDTLRRLLPAGGSIRDTETQAGYAGITIVDAAGTTRVDVNVQLDTAGHVEALFDCATRQVPDGTQCTVVTRPDGTRMLTADGPNAEGPAAIEERQADVLYPDGRRVVVIEWNAADETRGPITRPVPLFTLNQLITLATAPDWRN